MTIVLSLEAERLVAALAEQTGEDVAEAVEIAVQERLDRVAREARIKRVDATIARIQAELRAWYAEHPGSPSLWEINEAMYDEHGLPA